MALAGGLFCPPAPALRFVQLILPFTVHITFYSPQSLPSIGGLQYVVQFWAQGIAALGHRVHIITQSPATTAEEAALHTPDVFYHRGLSGWQQIRLMRRADRVLMFNVSLKGLPWWVLARLAGGPALYVSHHTALWYEAGPRPWQQRLKQWVANHLVRQQCACSQYIAGLYRHCRVVYSPIQAGVFVPGTVPRPAGHLFFAGRLVSDKGADLLLAAYAALLPQHPGLRLSMVGQGPELALLQQQCASLGLRWVGPEALAGQPAVGQWAANHPDVQVFFWGALPQPALVQHMQQCRVMVVPSRMEPMGMVVAEGLATGCTMVVARQGGLPEVGGAFCHYFQPGSIPDLTRALHEALTQPLQPNPVALQQHLQQFTVGYSVERVLTMLIC